MRDRDSAVIDIPVVPGHDVMVTPWVFGRAWLDCTCGLTRLYPSLRSANRAGINHLQDQEGGGADA